MYFCDDVIPRIKKAKEDKSKELYLTFCGLKEIPDDVFKLEDLQYLDLRHNNLIELPGEISKLKNLTRLDLEGNRLTKLPKEISRLKNLQNLSIKNNQLNELPKEITELKNLYKIDFEGNPLKVPPPEVIMRGMSAIRNYFDELGKEYDYLYEIKLLLVGEGRVGKTSLVKCLTIENYQLEDEQTTYGIDIKEWRISKEKIGLYKDFKFNIWDFGGQEIYHSTHQFFLTKRSIYLLVTEARKDDRYEDFYYWLNIIRLLGDKSPVIILQNKCDQPYRDIPISEYRKAFDTIVHFRMISCKPQPEYKHTIEALKLELMKLVKNAALLPHIGMCLPKVWIDIRNKLERLQRSGNNYISRDYYVEICEEYGMNEERSMYLSSFFHDLGVFLHFNTDWDLRDSIFLNHEWVTHAVYNVLDNDKIKKNWGVFENSDLIYIWKEKKYRHMRRELLALMKKFELCFELGKGKYLAPQLLPMDEPSYEWRTKDNLFFEYRYTFMPKGILTRLIVKLNKYIYRKTYWKYGVLLENRNTRAVIRERYIEGKITIHLEGHYKRELLALITKNILDIHSEFNNLEVEEMIPCNCKDCKDSEGPYFFYYSSLIRRLDKKKSTIECDKSFEHVNIKNLLGEVIIPRTYKWLFISYSHRDSTWLDKLMPHLKPLQKDGTIDLWSDKRIKTGEKWEMAIKSSLERARIAVLLISADFYASDFITEIELPTLLKNAENRDTKIISIILKPCRFKRDKSLSRFQALNDPDSPLISLTDFEQEQVFAKLAEIIEDI